MPSTYTASNGIEKVGIGEQANTWGQSLNNDLDLIDQSLDGMANIVLTGNTYTLNVSDGSVSNGRCRVILFSGSPSGTVTVTINPSNITKSYWIVNRTTQSVVLSNGSGTTLTIASNTTAPAFCDGLGNVTGFLSGNNSFSGGITVVGDSTFAGQLNVNTIAVNGWETINGNLTVDGSLTVAGQTISALVSSLIPSLTSMPGNLICSFGSASVSGGVWYIFTFGTTPGTRFRIAIGAGIGTDGQTVPLPSGFSAANALATCSLGQVSATTGHQLGNIDVYITSQTTINARASDGSGNNFAVTANWMAVAWANNY